MRIIDDNVSVLVFSVVLLFAIVALPDSRHNDYICNRLRFTPHNFKSLIQLWHYS